MPHRPPDTTLTSRLLVRLLDATSGWSICRAASVAAVAFALAMVADWETSAGVNVSFLYLVACAFAVWSMGRTAGLSLAFTVAAALSVMRYYQFQSGAYVHTLGAGAQTWNLVSRLLTFALIGLVVDGLRTALALERWHGSTDSLTGALNKGAFEGAVEQAAARARRHDHALVLAYMDLDGFKQVNDRHGHSAGDRVLRSFAAATMQAIRSTDLFARMGGDEFVALLTVGTCEEGERVAELLHRRLTAILAASGLSVTCSMGALVMSSRDAAMDDGVLEQADRLMYEVKRTGKNGFRVARGGAVGNMLHASYQPVEDETLSELLGRIDLVERNACRITRRAA